MYNAGVGDLSFSKKYNASYINYRWHLPMNGPVQYDSIVLPVNPYVVGCFLGDGCCTEHSLTISSNDLFIPEEIARLIGGDGAYRKSAKNYS